MSRMWRGARNLAAVVLLGLLCLAAKPLHPYRTSAGITGILAQSAHAGDCDQCHTVHGKGEIIYQHALLGPDDNTLCVRCHDTPWTGGSYAGPDSYLGSAHGSGNGTIWPGPEPPPRTEPAAAAKCLNCHDPHGWADATGIIPMLRVGREEKLCLACHDGSPALTNIGADLAKPFRHPVSIYTGRHLGPTESTPQDYAAAPQDNRHAECEDCHNPHVTSVDRPGVPPAPAMSRANLGVSRLLVQNGGPGAPPTFAFTAGSDTLSGPAAEYQLCFKCHSSWTTQPAGQSDLALELNPANASYHPVEAAGRDATIAPGAFVAGWNASSLTRCGDCHGSDFAGAPRGPHGSSYRYILKAPYEASSQTRLTSSDELCFSCHTYDVYANPGAADAVRAQSRFNKPGAVNGHAEHVGGANVPCYSCHVTHGAPDRGHLIVAGRMPGISAFTETPTGGTCQPTCHAPQSYTVTYAR
jgi:predicted CXXCH cytochrome family protein